MGRSIKPNNKKERRKVKMAESKELGELGTKFMKMAKGISPIRTYPQYKTVSICPLCGQTTPRFCLDIVEMRHKNNCPYKEISILLDIKM
jgi:hypothetical protein